MEPSSHCLSASKHLISSHGLDLKDKKVEEVVESFIPAMIISMTLAACMEVLLVKTQQPLQGKLKLNLPVGSEIIPQMARMLLVMRIK